jgi:hypothetical protein
LRTLIFFLDELVQQRSTFTSPTQLNLLRNKIYTSSPFLDFREMNIPMDEEQERKLYNEY